MCLSFSVCHLLYCPIPHPYSINRRFPFLSFFDFDMPKKCLCVQRLKGNINRFSHSYHIEYILFENYVTHLIF